METEQAAQQIAQPAAATAPVAWRKPWAAYNIIERPGLKGRIWSRVGTAWVNRDGSINVFLDSLPLTGKIQLRDDDRDGQARAASRGSLAIATDLPPATEA